MDDLTEMLTADGECGVRLVVPGAGAIGWKVEPPPWGKEAKPLQAVVKGCGFFVAGTSRFFLLASWNKTWYTQRLYVSYVS